MSDFPIQVSKFVKDKSWVIKNEGIPISKRGTYLKTATSRAIGDVFYSFSGSPMYTCPAGMFAYATPVITVDGPCNVLVTTAPHKDLLNTADDSTQEEYTFGSGGGLVPPRYEWYGEIGVMYISVSATVAGTSAECNVKWTIAGAQHCNDMNFNAKHGSFLVFGDSRVYSALGIIGTSGSVENKGNSLYSSRVVKMLKADGIDVRRNTYGSSGNTALKMYNSIIGGYYDAQIAEAAFLEFAMGFNDSSAGNVTTQKYLTTSMPAMIDHALEVNPSLAIILSQPYGTTATTQTTNLPGYRAALVTLAATYAGAGKDVVTWDQSAYLTTPTGVDANFSETVYSPPANEIVHAKGDTGHPLLANGLYACVKTTAKYYGFTGHH